MNLRQIVPTYIPPGTLIPFAQAPQAPRQQVLTNPTAQEEREALEPLVGKTVGLFGFGSQSSNHARCLRAEGINVVIVGRNPTSKSMQAATADGFTVVDMNHLPPIDVLGFGLPDDQQVRQIPAILKDLPRSTTLMMYHGMAVHYGLQGFYGSELKDALEGWGMGIVAPKGPGTTVWRNKQGGGGIACLFGGNNPEAMANAKAYCTALGGYRGAMLGTDFREETETDHYGEQGVLCGTLYEAYVFMVDFLQKKFGLSLGAAQAIAEAELVQFGDAIRRGGASYVMSTASEDVLANMIEFAGEFFGISISEDDLVDRELESVGAELRALQPHLSPVTPMGELVSGSVLPAPRPLADRKMGGIAGILLAASTWQYRLGREAGYTAEGLQFEVQQEIPLITDCVRFGGMAYMDLRISTTAKHGQFVSGRYAAESKGVSLRDRYGTILGAIQRGDYAAQTKRDLVDVPRGSDADWLWRATQAVIHSPEEAASIQLRPVSRQNFQGIAQPCVFIGLDDTPWGYSFQDKQGELLAA